tara:strand:+ start:21161 stop:21376 length:216 start_codon:yes stop_codon:yes gene_type:complete
MDDLKEDLLDTIAILKQTIQNKGFSSFLLVVISLILWPLFYLVISFGIMKIIISGISTITITGLLSAKLKK